MRVIPILKREPPLLIARELLWRARRSWNRQCLARRLESPGDFQLRHISYYKPEMESLDARGRDLVVAYAHEIVSGRFPFLGYPTAELGLEPAWSCDFVSGAAWPLAPLQLSQCIRFDGSDVKVPWELSRLQFLPVLGKAYVITGGRSYRQTAMELVTHWIRSNPAPLGVNWTSAMEASLRAMSICFLLDLLAPFRPSESQWLACATRSLAEHLHFIEANLEFSHFFTSNHYLSNLVGLYCLSVFLEGLGMPARRGRYRLRIEAEAARQVYQDGGDYEASTGYHVLVTQLFLAAFLLMRADPATAPTAPAFIDRLQSMFRFLVVAAGEFAELPHVGDCDDGRVELLLDDLEQMVLHPLGARNGLRISHLLCVGERLFGAATAPLEPITVLPDSGIGRIRHSSAELLFFVVPNGISGKGSHTHNDKLSFVLRIDGREVLCDPGAPCYTSDIVTRNAFRSTAAHNTVRIDGAEQNRIPPGPAGLFALGNDASVSPIEQGRSARGPYLRAFHTGYRSLGVTHTRTVQIVDEEPCLVIEDQLEGHGVHDFELTFELAPGRDAEIAESTDGILCRISGDPKVSLAVAAPIRLHASTQPALVSRAYGATVRAAKLSVWGHAPMPIRLETRVSWTERRSLMETHTLAAVGEQHR